MIFLAAVIVLSAALCTGALIFVLRPLLQRYALATPNARSSHGEPTAQGGGLALIATTIVVAELAVLALPDPAPQPVDHLTIVFAMAVLLAVTGFVDDIRPLPAVPRLLLQALAVLAVVATLPDDLRFVDVLPWGAERALLVLAGIWFLNLFNFMDGLDWMTVAEVVPVTGSLAVLGFFGVLPFPALVVALTLLGATLGFAPFNKPVARLFLGDVGSLPIGLLIGWLLMLLAANGHMTAAILLPLYYLADATITLFRRIMRGERIWHAHRSHFYQRAAINGLTVPEIVGRVFVTNLALAALALCSVWFGSRGLNVLLLLLGGILVGLLLRIFGSRV